MSKIKKNIRLFSILSSSTLAVGLALVGATGFTNYSKSNIALLNQNEEQNGSLFGETNITIKGSVSLPNIKFVNQGNTSNEWFKASLDKITSSLSQNLTNSINNILNRFLLENIDNIGLMSELNKNENWFNFKFTPKFSQSYNINKFDENNISWHFNLHDNFQGQPFKWTEIENPMVYSNVSLSKSFGAKGTVTWDGKKPAKNKKLIDTTYGDYFPTSINTKKFNNMIFNTVCLQTSYVSWRYPNTTNNNTFYFDLNLQPTFKNNKFDFKFNYLNLETFAFKNKNNNEKMYTGAYDLHGDCWIVFGKRIENVKLEFNDQEFTMTLPYDIDIIKKNIKKVLNTDFNLPNWTDNYDSIASNLISQAKQYIPHYLHDSFNFKYTPNIRSEKIDWTVSWKTLDGKGSSINATTKLKVPERVNLAKIYKEVVNYIQTPIKLFSNSSSVFDDPNIPTFINTKFDKELSKGVAGDLPKQQGYVVSAASNNSISLNNSNNYYVGNSFSNNINWSTTHRIQTNRQILLNYVKMIMNVFWNKYGSNFIGANPSGSINFETDRFSQQTFINVIFIFDNLPNSSVVNNQPSPWEFKIPVECYTTGFVSASGIEERLSLVGDDVPYIENGKVFVKKQTDQVPPTTNDGFRIVQSDGLKNGGTRLFFSSVDLNFKLDPAQNEIIKVNGNDLPVLNLNANTTLASPIEAQNENNSKYSGFKEYLIQIYNRGTEVYRVTVYIGNSSTPLEISYFGWNPEVNPEQKVLITPKNPDGTDNPRYNPEINPKTGTIEQLLWVNQPATVPMWPDPYNDMGKPTGNINTGWVSDGFLASGTVINKGIKINYENSTGRTFRTGLSFNASSGFSQSNNPTNNPNIGSNIGQTTQIQSSSENNPYYSYSGLWNYSIKSRFPGQQTNINDFGTYGQYFVNVVNQSSIESGGVNLSKFTDTLPKNSIVVPFWESYHGLNLKNYLVSNYGMKETDIEKMSYNEVLGWWNQYCFSGFNLQINIGKNINLANLNINPVKINESDPNIIKNEILSNIKFQLKEWNLVYKDQYEIVIDDNEVNKLVVAHANFKKETIKVKVVANKNQDKVHGEKNVLVINDPNLLNLSKISIPTILINNQSDNIEDIKNEIINQLNEIFSDYKVKDENGNSFKHDLLYGTDFIVDWEGIELLKINKDNPTRSLHFKIFAKPTSLYLAGSNEFKVINSADIDPTKLVNFNKIKVQNIDFNIAKKDKNITKIVISNYIFMAVRNAFEQYFNNEKNPGIEHKDKFMFEWNENIYSNTNMVYPKGYGDLWTINGYELGLEELVKNIENDNFTNVVTFTIEGNTNSLIARGGSFFKITNSITNSTNPEVPGMPDNPNDLIPDMQHTQNYLWLLGVFIPIIFILILVTYLIYYRIKTKKLK